MKSIFVSIEGNIGSGKSTFLNIISKKLKDDINNQKILILDEPVSDW